MLLRVKRSLFSKKHSLTNPISLLNKWHALFCAWVYDSHFLVSPHKCGLIYYHNRSCRWTDIVILKTFSTFLVVGGTMYIRDEPEALTHLCFGL